ncbi:MAG: hypothetical protein AAGH19_11245, partial [Pseudomonadota bacterium]
MKAQCLAAVLALGGLFSLNASADVVEGFVPHEEDLLGVRFRSFGNTGGREIFLGVPDLGIGGNRVEIDTTWSDGDFPFTFTLDRVNDTLRIQIAGRDLTYSNVSSRIAALKPDSPYTLFDLNLLQIDIAQRDAGTTVQLIDLQVNGGETNSFVPASNGFHTWTITNECVAVEEIATLSGTLRLSGTFGRSQENSRLEIKAGVREADELDCVTRTLDPQPDIFKNGLEPQEAPEPEEEQPTPAAVMNGPLGECTTSPWTTETGTVQALGVNTAPVGKKYEQDCALTVNPASPGFVTTAKPLNDKQISARFYFHAEDMALV